MTKWKTLAGKFTPEEIKLIKDFQKKLELNENQFVRMSVELILFYFGNMFKLAESKMDEEINKEYTGVLDVSICTYTKKLVRISSLFFFSKKYYQSLYYI